MICNLALLLNVAFLPFPTAVLAQALRTGEGTTVAAVFPGLVMVIGGIFFNAVWWGARRGGHLKDDTTPVEIGAITRRFTLGPLLYGVATALGLINAWLSIADLHHPHRILHDREPTTPHTRKASVPTQQREDIVIRSRSAVHRLRWKHDR